MTEWSRDLELEFRDAPVRLDLRLATVVVYMPTRPEPLSRIESGENWEIGSETGQ